MKPAIDLPLPELAFPDAGWRERFSRYVARAAALGLELVARLEPGAPEAALGALPARLRSLYQGANGGRIGHVHLFPLAQVAKSPAGFAFASDYAGAYAFAEGPHEVVLRGEEPGEEHRFSTLGTFLDAALVRAWAAALHRKAELEAGDDIDDSAWVLAARETELRIDAKMLRTRED
jgi:hypothetical protein